MRNFLIVLLSLVSGLSFGQWKMPARQVTVYTNNWNELNPTSSTAQAVFDYLDFAQFVVSSNISVNASNISVNASNISVYASNISVNASNISVNASNTSVNTSNILLRIPGTNIVGATYDGVNLQWAIAGFLSDTNSFLTGTNIVGYSYNGGLNQWEPEATAETGTFFSAIVSGPFTFSTANSWIAYTNSFSVITNATATSGAVTPSTSGWWLVSASFLFNEANQDQKLTGFAVSKNNFPPPVPIVSSATVNTNTPETGAIIYFSFSSAAGGSGSWLVYLGPTDSLKIYGYHATAPGNTGASYKRFENMSLSGVKISD